MNSKSNFFLTERDNQSKIFEDIILYELHDFIYNDFLKYLKEIDYRLKDTCGDKEPLWYKYKEPYNAALLKAYKGYNIWLASEIYNKLISEEINKDTKEIDLILMPQEAKDDIIKRYDIENHHIDKIEFVFLNIDYDMYIPYVGTINNKKIQINFKKLNFWANNHSW